MLYREIIAVCSQIHTKHINTLCGQNVGFLAVKGGVACSYLCTLKVYVNGFSSLLFTHTLIFNNPLVSSLYRINYFRLNIFLKNIDLVICTKC
jgi:hypothetical protein